MSEEKTSLAVGILELIEYDMMAHKSAGYTQDVVYEYRCDTIKVRYNALTGYVQVSLDDNLVYIGHVMRHNLGHYYIDQYYLVPEAESHLEPIIKIMAAMALEQSKDRKARIDTAAKNLYQAD